jgi:hypothetical protein
MRPTLLAVLVKHLASATPTLAWWDFEQNDGSHDFLDSNGGPSFYTQQTTATMSTTGGISGRMGTRTGAFYTTGSPYDISPPATNLVYIPSTDPNFSQVRNVSSLSMGGWFTLRPPANGAIDVVSVLGTITPGSGYVNNTYTNVPLTSVTGTGSGAYADITVSGGIVTVVTNYINTGTGYTIGDILSASNTNLGGTGSGFSIPVTAINNFNLGGEVIDFGNTSFSVDVTTNIIYGTVTYGTLIASDDGFALTSGSFTLSGPLVLLVVTFDHLTGLLSLYSNGSFVSNFTVTDWVSPFAETGGNISNPWIGGAVANDIWSGIDTSNLDFDSVFYLKNQAITSSDVTYLYNSGAGRTMAQFKSHIGL